MSNEVMNFADIYEIKNFFISELAPKYFDVAEINQFNVGLLGYTTEMSSVSLEETFNAMNTMYKEQFASKATFEDTIYTKAGILGIDGFNAIPARLHFGILIKTKDVVNTRNLQDDKYIFTIDKDTVVYIEDIPFSLDYDVVITAFESPEGTIYTAEYDMSIPNSISYNKTAQIRVIQTHVSGDDYILMMVNIRQYKRKTQQQDLMVSSSFNYPTVEVTYEKEFGGMDILYRESPTSPWTPLEKIFTGAPPLRRPFIYYRHVEKGLVELSFTTRDTYFKPSYNSEIKVRVYQTRGLEGEFKEYNGVNIGISNPSGSTYGNSVVLQGYPNGASHSARSMKTIEDLRQEVIEKKATSGAYNTDSDLETYFNNRTKSREGTFVKFIKRRDDLTERLFSCFGLYKDKKGDFFHTNTLGMMLFEKEFDTVLDNDNRFLLQPGKKFFYSKEGNFVTLDGSGLTKDNELFVYTNPFLISMQKDPNTIAFYNNSVFATPSLEYLHSSKDSAYQFTVNNISVTRNAVSGEDSYQFNVVLKPLFEIDVIDDGTKIDIGVDAQIVLAFREGDGDSKAIIMDLDNYSAINNTLTYTVQVGTTDEVSSTERVILKGLYDLSTGRYGDHPVPMINTKISLSILVNDGKQGDNPFSEMPQLTDYRLISSFINATDSFNLITPLKHIRTTVKFFPYHDTGIDDPNIDSKYFMMLDLVPLVSYELGQDRERTAELFKEVEFNYAILNDIMNLKTQNYSLDLKFYNTYGKGRNYSIGEGEVIDRVNITIKLGLGINTGYMKDEVIDEVKIFVKKHIEDMAKSINQNFELRGYNSMYISSLIQDLKNNIPSIKYIVFNSLNDYSPLYQLIEHESVDYSSLSKEERRGYVPEYLTIDYDQVIVEVLK